MNTQPIKVTLDLTHHDGCSHEQSALVRDLTKDTSISALLSSLGADTLEIRFATCHQPSGALNP